MEEKEKMIKKPQYTPQEINSNIAYGMTSVNNITQDELNSIQWLCEKSMNDDYTIAELKQQLEEKEKEIEKYRDANIIVVGERSQGKKHLMEIKIKELQNQKALEQLEQIINLFEPYENEEKDTILCANNGISFLEYIDNQINELKEGKVENEL